MSMLNMCKYIYIKSLFTCINWIVNKLLKKKNNHNYTNFNKDHTTCSTVIY